MWQTIVPIALSLGFGSLAHFGYAADSCASKAYQVGAAQSDITGPIAELGLLGYADLGQVGEGLHMRLRSRALVVSDGCGQQPVALVIADQALMFHGVKQAVLDRLQKEIPGVFDHRNLVLSVTHTHSGPGGYAHHALYNVTTFGYSQANFEAIVSGTVRSIIQAWRQKERGRKRHLKRIPSGARNHSFVSFCCAENSAPGGRREPNFCDLPWPWTRTYTPPLFTRALSLYSALINR